MEAAARCPRSGVFRAFAFASRYSATGRARGTPSCGQNVSATAFLPHVPGVLRIILMAGLLLSGTGRSHTPASTPPCRLRMGWRRRSSAKRIPRPACCLPPLRSERRRRRWASPRPPRPGESGPVCSCAVGVGAVPAQLRIAVTAFAVSPTSARSAVAGSRSGPSLRSCLRWSWLPRTARAGTLPAPGRRRRRDLRRGTHPASTRCRKGISIGGSHETSSHDGGCCCLRDVARGTVGRGCVRRRVLFSWTRIGPCRGSGTSRAACRFS